MDRHTFRLAWGKYGLLALLVVAGAAGGLYLSGGLPAQPLDILAPATNAPVGPHHFALTALDAKDTAEAPDLAIGPDGTVMLAWASKTADAERTVFFSRSTDGGRTFETPQAMSKGGIYRTASKGRGRGFERRATPHLAAVGVKVYLAWGEALPDGSGMRMVLAVSADRGETFGPSRSVHSEKKANPTFTALAFGPGGALACSWLDDRAGAQLPFAAVRWAGKGAFDPERMVYSGQNEKGVCPCCPTAACFAPDGTLYIAFRNVKDGYRDIAIGRSRAKESNFDGPFPVIPNTWKFDGCPHDGPSLAVIGDTLHVAWMDARSGPQRCYHAQARTSNMKFEARELHPGVSGTQGNAKLFADSEGRLHAVWEESLGAEPQANGGPTHHHGAPKVGAGGGRAVMYAVVPAGQVEFGPARAVAPKPGGFQTRPTIVGTANGGLFVAWNELDETGKAVVVTRLGETGEK